MTLYIVSPSMCKFAGYRISLNAIVLLKNWTLQVAHNVYA